MRQQGFYRMLLKDYLTANISLLLLPLNIWAQYHYPHLMFPTRFHLIEHSGKYVLRSSTIFKCSHISDSGPLYPQMRMKSMQKLFSQNILQSAEPCNNFWTWIGYLKPDRYFRTMYIAKSLSTHATDGLYWEEDNFFHHYYLINLYQCNFFYTASSR